MQSTGQPPVRQYRYDKPLLFSHLKNQLEIPSSTLDYLFSLNIQDTFTIQLGEIELYGIVTDQKIDVYNSAISTNLRLLNFKNALFNIVSIKNADNIPRIRGRIIHPKFGDVLILVPENGKYYLRKEEQRLVLTE